MTRRIDIEREADQLRIEFPYDEELVRTVKTLPGRRWDPDQRAWFVPAEHVERVLETLLDHHFKLSARLREYCEEHARPVAELTDDGLSSGPVPVPPDTLAISDVNVRAEAALEAEFDDDLWVVGELQGFDRAPDRGHAFFELVERPTEDADPVAKIRAVMFEGDRERIERALADGRDDVRLRDGLAVRLRGCVDLYKASGSYQFVVDDIDQTYTAGRIQRRRRAILEGLDERGIREQNRRRDWPRCPLRVGLVTSWSSDARRDFCRELDESPFGFEVAAHDAYVQGDRAEESLLRALDYFETRAEDFDAVAIVRGGGARSDLAYFDTEAIGEAVCEHPLKIVSGIGHQRDACLVDHLADARKTPTAAAAAFVDRVESYRDRMVDALESVVDRARERVQRADERLGRISSELRHWTERRVVEEDRRLSEVRSQLGHLARGRLESARHRMESALGLLPRAVDASVTRRRQRLDRAEDGLDPSRLLRPLERRRLRLDRRVRRLERAAHSAVERGDRRVEACADQLSLLDPTNVLERGFALVRRDGEIVGAAQQAPEGASIDVELANGELRATVDRSRIEDHEDD